MYNLRYARIGQSAISRTSALPPFPPRRVAHGFLEPRGFSQVNLRHATLQAGEDKSGHISTEADEGILFFDNVFPLRLKWLLRLPWQTDKKIGELMKRVNGPSTSKADPVNVIKDSKTPISVTDVLPRFKEGGAFVKFTYGPGASAADVEKTLKEYMKTARVHPWWNPLQRCRANLVHGKPWVEDLYRLPSTRLKVEFLPAEPGLEATELGQEQLYTYFRPYGKLTDIVSQPADSKVLPKYAFLEFTGTKRAVMAKNCLHGIIVPESKGGGKTGTLLRLSYEAKVKSNWIKDWLFNHPRIVIPIVAALVATLTVAIFDPIRTFFIKTHITRSWHLTDYRIYRWFKEQASDILTFHRKTQDDAGMEIIWDDRKPIITQIQSWLLESADTFIIVQGPRGSGKRELVLDQALKHRKNTLLIDCIPIQDARGDSATINAAATEVGYRPVFSWMNSISGMVDLAAQGTTGVKTGFSETLDTQLGKVFNNTATALKQIALESRKKDDKDINLSDDEYLETHPEKRPVVVIDNFLHKSQENSLVYDKIAEWGARLTSANIAHVVFLTNDVSFSKSLSKALPDRVFRQVSLSDASPGAAKRYVISHLDSEGEMTEDPDNPGQKLTPSQRRRDLFELDECINSLGGRLTDLEFLARRIKAGETPKKAVREIVEQSSSEILKMYLFGQDETNGGQRKWTSEQAWFLIKQLADAESLRYNETLLSDTFKGHGDSVLQALEQAELISIVVAPNGRPRSIKPGKPVYLPAFKRLTEDAVLSSRLDLAILADLIKIESATIDKCENELKLLGSMPRQPEEVTPRVRWLLGKVGSSQAKIEKYEVESGMLKKVLQEEY
ncbi:hypothetical protein EJ08DRAFT_33254 [Tothia fuscella]|uniref:Mitochondrial escape protein 2 n=1 Tax=Tothia fuscella TaxID=1048955 RepID=A0A9P4NFX3_9PEZI|nr:hypothetical protein EJ08DRAFT_33254 [Tothia fuscella]